MACAGSKSARTKATIQAVASRGVPGGVSLLDAEPLVDPLVDLSAALDWPPATPRPPELRAQRLVKAAAATEPAALGASAGTPDALDSVSLFHTKVA